jgi:hypothetical protein
MPKHIPWLYLVALLVSNLALTLPSGSWPRLAGALLLIGFLPGLSWAIYLTPQLLTRLILATALSYSFATLITLLLHYLPGPIQIWQLPVPLNLLALIPWVVAGDPTGFGRPSLWRNLVSEQGIQAKWNMLKNLLTSTDKGFSSTGPLLLVLIVAVLLRTVNLDYSEFQGDEALAMIAAAEALEGHEDALFLRSKGPGEVLLPLALWRLTGVINEATARLPFTGAACLAIVTLYLIGEKLVNRRVGWLAAGFFAANGFMVAFGRIVQYQALVVWFSALAFYLTLEWSQTKQLRFAGLAGLCLGLGLLAHYDAILAAPALIGLIILPWSGVTKPQSPASLPQIAQSTSLGNRIVKPALLFGLMALLTASPFYLPFALNPQANRIGDYLGQRIGAELRNNLPDFFHFNTFYSSFYYVGMTTILVLGLLVWLLHQTYWSRWWAPFLLLGGVLVVIFRPDIMMAAGLNWAFLPFVLLFLGAWVVALLHYSWSGPASYFLALLIWLAIPFLGYNFVVALGLTHIYTIVPAWSLLAAVGWYYCFDHRPVKLSGVAISNYLLVGLLIASTIFLWNAFVRHDVEYWQDYPQGNLPLYWTPYAEPPQAGFFGFAHRSGWKAVGQKIVSGELSGDYGSNEEPDVTTWYTRGAPRACDPQPEFYFLADDLIDPVRLPPDLLDAAYSQIGQVTLPNQKQMRIMQLKPNQTTLGNLDEVDLSTAFDQSATPAVFARSARGAVQIEANFSHLVKLIGYSVDTRRAYPGGRIPVALFWQALTPIPISYQVFTHLAGDSGPLAQADGVPVCWSYPTDRWRPGQIIADQHAVYLSPDLPLGNYPLQIGLYQADTLARLDVLDALGNPAGTSVTLTQISIISSP